MSAKKKKKRKSEGAVLVSKTDEVAFAATATESSSDALSAKKKKKKKDKHRDSDWKQCQLYIDLCYANGLFNTSRDGEYLQEQYDWSMIYLLLGCPDSECWLNILSLA